MENGKTYNIKVTTDEGITFNLKSQTLEGKEQTTIILNKEDIIEGEQIQDFALRKLEELSNDTLNYKVSTINIMEL